MGELVGPCPRGYTSAFEKVCFAPFRYCPEKGCGRTEPVEPLPPVTQDPETDAEAMRAFLKIRTAPEQEQMQTQWDVYLQQYGRIRDRLDDPNFTWDV